MKAVDLEKRLDGVAVLTMDNPDGPHNILSRELFSEFRRLLEEVRSDPHVKAAVLISGKRDFLAGADIKSFFAMKEPAEGEEVSREGHALLDLIASSPKPFVAAIHGQALGGGVELALACHYRLATDDPATVLALPEVTLGLLPGGGGTQRLPRLVGLAPALPLLLTGQRVRARKALRLGLVDALTSPGGLRETAAQAARRLAEGTLRPRRRRRRLLQRLMERPPLRGLVFRQARKGVLSKTRGLYPAPLAILECVREGYEKGLPAGFRKEEVLFGGLCASEACKGLLGLALSMIELKKPLPGPEGRKVETLGILGGGFMGAGIASVSLKLCPVVVKDVNDGVLGKCAKTVWEGLSKQVKSGALSRFERDRLFARFHPALDYGDLRRADLVVEAVFEDLDLKRRVLAETEAVVSPECVFASNTSALPIASIAEKARVPERVLGMHYFSPVPKMPLLEIVVTPKTSPQALATARAFGVAQGKTCIVVKDGPGFYTTRILSPFLNEAMVLLEEGAAVEAVDGALKDFGYPVGPVALLDEVGIDVGAHVAKEFGDAYASRGLSSSKALPVLFEAGYHGRKNGKGFYRYGQGRRGKKPVNREVYAFFGGLKRKEIPAAEMAERLAFLMVNEAVWCLQEGVIASPRDGDVGAILGLGFPPFRGGPFRYLDTLGAAEAVRRMEGYAERLGPRFRPAPLLLEAARKGERFYGGP